MSRPLTDLEFAYIEGFLDYLMNWADLPDGATDAACIEALEGADRDRGNSFSLRGKSGHDVYFDFLEQGARQNAS